MKAVFGRLDQLLGKMSPPLYGWLRLGYTLYIQNIFSDLTYTQLSSKAEGKANNVHISEKGAHNSKRMCWAIVCSSVELLRDGFGTQGRLYFHVLVAELTSDATTSAVSAVDPERPSTSMPHDDRIVGLALYFYMYPPWSGKSLFLDHVFVRVEYRSKFTITSVA